MRSGCNDTACLPKSCSVRLRKVAAFIIFVREKAGHGIYVYEVGCTQAAENDAKPPLSFNFSFRMSIWFSGDLKKESMMKKKGQLRA